MTDHSPHTLTGEAGPCWTCGEPCYPVSAGYFRHGRRCGELLPILKEPCGRREGHGYEHRSAYALENAAARQRRAGFAA